MPFAGNARAMAVIASVLEDRIVIRGCYVDAVLEIPDVPSVDVVEVVLEKTATSEVRYGQNVVKI